MAAGFPSVEQGLGALGAFVVELDYEVGVTGEGEVVEDVVWVDLCLGVCFEVVVCSLG